MRIPLKINRNVLEVYKPTPETLALLDEVDRKIRTEELDWDDDHFKTLVDICVERIASRFERYPWYHELPFKDKDYLLEILTLELPIELAINLIEDQQYWQRRYKHKYGTILIPKPIIWDWKSLYIEKFIEIGLEEAEPSTKDEYDRIPDMQLCASYIKRLILQELQVWNPPLTALPEEIPEFLPCDHIEFEPVFSNLPLIEEISVRFGPKKLFYKFEPRMFYVSKEDGYRLGKAVNLLTKLTDLRIHQSELNDEHINALVHGLIDNKTIRKLEISSCTFGDHGAMCIAKLIMVHPALRLLNLSNNRIGAEGTEAIGYAILQKGSARIRTLNLSMNPLREAGAMGIFRALIRQKHHIEHLLMAGCFFDNLTHLRAAQMIMMNNTLKSINFRNNYIGEESGELIVDYVEKKRSIVWMDMRNTGITATQERHLKKICERNRLGLPETEPSIEEAMVEEEEEMMEMMEEMEEEKEDDLLIPEGGDEEG